MPAGEATLRRVEGWLFAPGDPRRLAAVRVGLCGLLAIRLASGPYAELATQPPALFRPISFLRLLDRMPSPEAVAALQAPPHRTPPGRQVNRRARSGGAPRSPARRDTSVTVW